MLLDGQPPAVAFTVLPQLCGPKANETDIGATLFTKIVEGRNFEFDLKTIISFVDNKGNFQAFVDKGSSQWPPVHESALRGSLVAALHSRLACSDQRKETA